MAIDRLRAGWDMTSLVQLRIRGTVVYIAPVCRHSMAYLTALLLTRRATKVATPAKARRPALCHLRSSVLSEVQDLPIGVRLVDVSCCAFTRVYSPEQLKHGTTTPDGYRHPLGTGARISHSSKHGRNEVRNGQGQAVRGVDDHKEICPSISNHCKEGLEWGESCLVGVPRLVSITEDTDVSKKALLWGKHLRFDWPIGKDEIH